MVNAATKIGRPNSAGRRFTLSGFSSSSSFLLAAAPWFSLFYADLILHSNLQRSLFCVHLAAPRHGFWEAEEFQH